jgi:hypothetical protein
MLLLFLSILFCVSLLECTGQEDAASKCFSSTKEEVQNEELTAGVRQICTCAYCRGQSFPDECGGDCCGCETLSTTDREEEEECTCTWCSMRHYEGYCYEKCWKCAHCAGVAPIEWAKCTPRFREFCIKAERAFWPLCKYCTLCQHPSSILLLTSPKTERKNISTWIGLNFIEPSEEAGFPEMCIIEIVTTTIVHVCVCMTVLLCILALELRSKE